MAGPSSSIIRLTLELTSANSKEVYEPNPLHLPDGMQPNASGFYNYFSSSEKRQAFAMILLEVLSS